jgi:hypothetical protein
MQDKNNKKKDEKAKDQNKSTLGRMGDWLKGKDKDEKEAIKNTNAGKAKDEQVDEEKDQEF